MKTDVIRSRMPISLLLNMKEDLFNDVGGVPGSFAYTSNYWVFCTLVVNDMIFYPLKHKVIPCVVYVVDPPSLFCDSRRVFHLGILKSAIVFENLYIIVVLRKLVFIFCQQQSVSYFLVVEKYQSDGWSCFMWSSKYCLWNAWNILVFEDRCRYCLIQCWEAYSY